MAFLFLHPLYTQMCADQNLQAAWRAVRRHSETPGLDGMTAAHFDSRSFVLLNLLQCDLRRFKYAPQPVKRIFMKREIGPPRPLGIPIFLDRIVQRALVQVLLPIFEPHFDECSHAYRTGRSPQTALAQARDFARSRPWLVKIDLQDCFGNIPRQPLLRAVYRRVKDFAVRKLLKQFLAVEVITESRSGLRQVSRPGKGLLQGSPLSPLLANIYLHDFDLEMRRLNFHFVRYGDDIALFAHTRPEAEAALEAATHVLRNMHMPLNREKTKLLHLSRGLKYLGEWLSVRRYQ